MTSGKRACARCEFFDPQVNSPYGHCKRFPPVVVPCPTDNQLPVLYTPMECRPTTRNDDWCGEFEEREQ